LGLTARKAEAMTEVDLQAVFPALEAQAARLNDASDNANRVLASVETRLVNLNIGLEVWYAPAIDSADSEGDLGPYKTSSRVIQVLGFARVDGKWCLAVKPIRVVSGFFQGDMDCPFENQYAAGPPSPLLKSSRGLRLAALRAMPKLLAQLNEQMASTIHDLEDAANPVGGGK